MMTTDGEDVAEKGENNNVVEPQTSKEAQATTCCNGVGSGTTADQEPGEDSLSMSEDQADPDVLLVAPPEAIILDPESAESDVSEPESGCSRLSGIARTPSPHRHREDKMCQTTSAAPTLLQAGPRRQSLVVVHLLRRLSEQEAATERLRLEKDRQLGEITGSLLVFEGHLRREQERISRLLEERDARIAEQDRHIQALLRLNRRLAAKRGWERAAEGGNKGGGGGGGEKKSKRQQRRISWHNEVRVITDYDKHWTRTNFRSGLGEVRRIEDYGRDRGSDDGSGRTRFQKEVDDACEAVNMMVRGSDSDSPPVVDDHDEQLDDDRLVFPSRGSLEGESDVSVLPDAEEEENGDGDREDHHPSLEEGDQDSPPPCLPNPPNLGLFYNRVMSNHRSVTKPKDVKYKKISRVKSRSLEELRGRLRKQMTHPLGFPTYPLLLESSEETP